MRGARSFGPLTCPQGLARGTRASGGAQGPAGQPCTAGTLHVQQLLSPDGRHVLDLFLVISPTRRQEVPALVFTGEDEGELLGHLAHALLRCQPTAPGPAPAQHAHHGSTQGRRPVSREGRSPASRFPLSLFLTGILTSGQEEMKTFLDLQARSHLSLSTAQRSWKTNSEGAEHQ